MTIYSIITILLLLQIHFLYIWMQPYGFECRDPDLGGQIPEDRHKHRKFLVVSGAGNLFLLSTSLFLPS
jgi:hypothetical protein